MSTYFLKHYTLPKTCAVLIKPRLHGVPEEARLPRRRRGRKRIPSLARTKSGNISGASTRTKKDVIAEAAEALIRERAYPVPLSEIFEVLQSKGIEIGTTNPKQNLSSTLNRDGRFQSITGKGWVMKPKHDKGPEAAASEPLSN